MEIQETKPGAPGFFGRMSLTAKLASVIVIVNLAGLAAMDYWLQQSATDTLRRDAFVNWTREVQQIGQIAAGGIKWNVPEAIEGAYSGYAGSTDHDLRQIIAYNSDGVEMASWERDGYDAAEGRRDIEAVMQNAPGEAVVDDFPLGDGKVTIVVPLEADSEDNLRGHIATVWSTERLAATGVAFGKQTLALQAVCILIVVGLFLLALRSIVSRPLADLTRRIDALDRGDLVSPVPHRSRADTIGVVANALESFRLSAQEKQAAQADAARQRSAFESERERNEAESRQVAEAREAAMETVGDALQRLSKGDLTVRIETIDEAFAALRDDFNAAVASLGETMSEISETTHSVRGSSGEIAKAADDLSRRTEQQAASLEETAAALDEITQTVRQSEQRAEEANRMVADATAGARASRAVVADAISAMERIETSSTQISQIIGVIDDIAFQTNLLALNAGVEAARAGEAGKGFAVVAQEVRELAQRSAGAAKEIKELIRKSGDEVGAGVAHVNKTGGSLEEIERHVHLIKDHIAAIVTSAREQSAGLQEINTAVNQMDQVTQQNAAMVEQTNAACVSLEEQAKSLRGLVGRFELARGAAALARDRGGPVAVHATQADGRARFAGRSSAVPARESPARALGRKLAGAFGGGATAAVAQPVEDDGWTEF